MAVLAHPLAEPAIDVMLLGALSAAEWAVNVAALSDSPSRAHLDAIVTAGRVDPYRVGAPTAIIVPTPPLWLGWDVKRAYIGVVDTAAHDRPDGQAFHPRSSPRMRQRVR